MQEAGEGLYEEILVHTHRPKSREAKKHCHHIPLTTESFSEAFRDKTIEQVLGFLSEAMRKDCRFVVIAKYGSLTLERRR